MFVKKLGFKHSLTNKKEKNLPPSQESAGLSGVVHLPVGLSLERERTPASAESGHEPYPPGGRWGELSKALPNESPRFNLCTLFGFR